LSGVAKKWPGVEVWPVFRIRPDPKLFGLKDPDPKLLFSDPAPDPDPSLFHTKLRKDVLKMN